MINPIDFEWLRWTGAAILFVMLILGIFIITRYPLGKQASISLHIATDRRYYVLMALLLTVGGGIFYAFLILWLMPTYHMSNSFYTFLVLAYLAQLGLAWIPDKKPADSLSRKLHFIHFTCGAIVAITMILSLYFLCFSFEYLPIISRVFVILSAIFSTACIVLFSFFKQTRKHFLFYESGFIILFAAAMFSLIFKL